MTEKEFEKDLFGEEPIAFTPDGRPIYKAEDPTEAINGPTGLIPGGLKPKRPPKNNPSLQPRLPDINKGIIPDDNIQLRMISDLQLHTPNQKVGEDDQVLKSPTGIPLYPQDSMHDVIHGTEGQAERRRMQEKNKNRK